MDDFINDKLSANIVKKIYPNDYIECFGKGTTDDQIKVSALMEAVERYSSFLTDQELIRGSFNDLKNIAVDPKDFVLSPTHFREYSDDLPIEWTWAYSLCTNKSVLVPALFTYLIYHDPKTSDHFFVNSNGLSSGNCIEEAILHGICEVVERDALFIMHRNMLCMPDVDPKISELRKILDTLDNRTIRYYVKNTTLDIPLPSFSVFLVNESVKPTTYSHSVCTHINPKIALIRAFTEAFQISDTKKIPWTSCIEHLYKKGKYQQPMQDILDTSSKTDIKDNIESIIKMFKERNLDILVVNLTHPEIDIAVVKILIPKLQPIDDDKNPRISQRILTIPKILGYRSDNVKREDLMMGPTAGAAKINIQEELM